MTLKREANAHMTQMITTTLSMSFSERVKCKFIILTVNFQFRSILFKTLVACTAHKFIVILFFCRVDLNVKDNPPNNDDKPTHNIDLPVDVNSRYHQLEIEVASELGLDPTTAFDLPSPIGEIQLNIPDLNLDIEDIEVHYDQDQLDNIGNINLDDGITESDYIYRTSDTFFFQDITDKPNCKEILEKIYDDARKEWERENNLQFSTTKGIPVQRFYKTSK